MIAWLAHTWPFFWAYRRGYIQGQKMHSMMWDFEREDRSKIRAEVKKVSDALDNNVDLQDLVEVCTRLMKRERELM